MKIKRKDCSSPLCKKNQKTKKWGLGTGKQNPAWHDGKVEDWEGLVWGLRKKQ